MINTKNLSRNKPIGIFDSGVGGLTVFKEVKKVLPYEDIIYLGDTAHLPYGNKSRKTIIRFTIENILFLLKKKVKLIIIACNTSSSLALDYIKKIFSLPIIGVIEPAVKKAVEVSLNKKIGVIGTKSTIESKIYERLILKKEKKAKVYSLSCPLFVPLVEEGFVKGKITQMIIRFYLKKLKGRIDTLILGCTHYPLLKKEISSYLKEVKLIDSASSVAEEVRILLENLNLLNNKRKPVYRFYVSDDPQGFFKTAKFFLKDGMDKREVYLADV